MRTTVTFREDRYMTVLSTLDDVQFVPTLGHRVCVPDQKGHQYVGWVTEVTHEFDTKLKTHDITVLLKMS